MIEPRPPAMTRTDASGLPRTTLLVMPGGRNGPGIDSVADHLARETDELMETLEGTIVRLALAHRSCMSDPEDHDADDDAFAWVQQSLEDIAATLRGLSLRRSSAAADAPSVADSADAPQRALTGLG